MGMPVSQNTIPVPVSVANGGTGAASAAAARTALGVPSATAQRFEPAVAWGRNAVAAALTDSALEVGGVVALGVAAWVAKTAGSITGLSVALSIVGAGATLTTTVFKNGSATAAAATVTAGNSAGRATFASGAVTFVAGDKLDIRITTPGGWTAVTAALLATIEVEA